MNVQRDFTIAISMLNVLRIPRALTTALARTDSKEMVLTAVSIFYNVNSWDQSLP